MIDIILLTAVIRVKNLPIMYDSIKRAFGATYEERLKNGVSNLQWVIVKDRYNCKGDISEFYKTLFEDKFPFYGFEDGKPNQKNYGGDIYNNALKWLFNNYCINGRDPWIYIFDDDNVINPLIPYFVSKMDEKYPNKRGIWLRYEGINGCPYDIHEYNAFTEFFNIANSKKLYYRNPDPSGVVLKASVYKENFPLKGRVDYDYTHMREIVRKLFHNGELAFPDDIENWKDRVGAYHNGIRFDEDLKWDIEHCEDLGLTCVVQDNRLSPTNYGRHRFIIPKEANKEILEIIKKYNYAITKYNDD